MKKLSVLFLFLLITNLSLLSAAWRYADYIPILTHLYAAHGVASDDIWIVGEAGMIFHWNGAECSRVNSGVSYDLQGIWCAASDDCYAVGDESILHWNGYRWESIPGTSGCHKIWGFDANDIWATANNKVLHWDGISWSSVNGSRGGNDLHGTGPDNLNIMSTGVDHWNGSSWQYIPRPQSTSQHAFTGLWSNSANEIYIVGAYYIGLPEFTWISDVYKWDGSAWSHLFGGYARYFEDIWGFSSDDIYATGWGVTHYPNTKNTGVTDCDFVWGLAPNDMIFLGPRGRFMRYNGDTSEEYQWTHTMHYRKVWAASEHDVFAAGDGGINYWDGFTWTPMPLPETADITGIWGSLSFDLYATDRGGFIYHWDGTTFEQVHETNKELLDIWGASADDIFVVGSDGLVLRGTGSNWQMMASPATQDLQTVHGLSGDELYIGGNTATGGSVFYWNGVQWDRITGDYAPPVEQLFVADSDHVYLASEYGVYWYNGATWQHDTTYTNTLHGIWGTSNENIYAVGTYGNIGHFNGSSWTYVYDSPTLEDLYAVSGFGDVVYVAGDYNIIFQGTVPPASTGVAIEIPITTVHPNEPFWIRATLNNAGPQTLQSIPVFFVLELYGDFYFWPRWTYYSSQNGGELDYQCYSLPPGKVQVNVIQPFYWPDTGSDSLSGINLYGAILSQDLTTVIGDMDMVTFGYGPW